jgi:hypothetical protein
MRFTPAALLGLAFALGCDSTGPAAPSELNPSLTRHDIIHIDDRSGTFELRGLEGCFGELVIVTGTVRYKEHTMTDPATANQDHTSFTFFEQGTAVGQQTGRVWKFKETLTGRFNTPNLSAPQGNFSRTATTHFIGSRGSLMVKTTFHAVIKANGVVKAVVDFSKGPCSAI